MENFGILLAIFVPAEAIMSLVLGGFIGSVIVIAGLFIAYFFLMQGRPINITCESCNKTILSSTPWICPVCRKNNLNTSEFSFLYRCEHCNAEPKAYECHHKNCGAYLYLTADESELLCAKSIGAPERKTPELPSPQEVLKEEREQARWKRQGERETTQWEIEKSRLDADLAQATANLKMVKGEKKSLEEDLAERKAKALRLHEIYEREREAAEKIENINLREMTFDFLEDWKNRHLG